MNAISAFLASGFQIQTAQFLSNRNKQAENLASQVPPNDDGVVIIADTLAREGKTSYLEPPTLFDLFV